MPPVIMMCMVLPLMAEIQGGVALLRRPTPVGACAVELAHAANLVKDDVMDKDEVRRGLSSFFKRFGLDLALLLPDILIPRQKCACRPTGLGRRWM